jgi:diguanylate cyclase (GGDEF)-like protein/PAS domain S-box-containing protein
MIRSRPVDTRRKVPRLADNGTRVKSLSAILYLSPGVFMNKETDTQSDPRDDKGSAPAEAALRYRVLFDQSPDGILLVDTEGNIIEFNEAAHRQLGYSREEFANIRIRDIEAYETPAEIEGSIRDVLKRGRARFEVAHRTRSGEIRNVLVITQTMMLKGKTVFHTIWRDVTDEKRAKDELHKAYEELEGRVQERTDALARSNEELRRMEEAMRHMAHHDPLTGLPNRRFFMDIVRIELAEAHRHQKRAAVFFLDLDRFKVINDTLGHAAGDELLKQVALRIRTSIRESDTIARVGGDEFNIILPHITHVNDIAPTARKIMDSFREPYIIAGHRCHVTTSIGISVYPDDGEDIDTLLRYADIAMYNAKDSGRNSYRFHNPAINVRSIERMRLESTLRQALEGGGLTLYYQPQVDINSQKILCAEALVRWQHPELGLMDSRQFIGLAEETGLAIVLDDWVLRTACRQLKTWRDAGLRPFCITVNLSLRQFHDPGLVDTVVSILAATGVPPEYLELEISESTAMVNIELTTARLNELATRGVRVSIDNFGAGYSSVNYLRRMPVHRLKIDQSLVRDIVTDHDDRAIVSAITAMAHKMDMKVVAGGVETADQLAVLSSVECDEAQGFLFSKPLSAEEFSKLISART